MVNEYLPIFFKPLIVIYYIYRDTYNYSSVCSTGKRSHTSRNRLGASDELHYKHLFCYGGPPSLGRVFF